MTGMRVLDAMGQAHIYNDTATPEMMKAFRINLGALGVITEVTIKVQPTILLKKTTKVLNSTSNYTEKYNQMAELYNQHDRMTLTLTGMKLLRPLTLSPSTITLTGSRPTTPMSLVLSRWTGFSHTTISRLCGRTRTWLTPSCLNLVRPTM